MAAPATMPPQVDQGGGVNAALRDIRALRTQLADPTSLQALLERVEALEDRFATTVEEPFLRGPSDQLDPVEVEELLRLLPRLSPEVEQTTEEITEAIVDVREIQDSLRTLEDRWSRSVAGSEQEDVAPQLATVVQSLVALADSARVEATERVGELIVLEGRAVALGTRIDELELEAERRQESLLAGLLEQDSDPIWTVLGRGAARQLAGDAATVLERLRDGVVDLVATYRGRLILHGIAGLLFLGLVLGIRRSPALVEATELQIAGRILRRPLAVTVILTLALTQALYPTAQPAVVALNTVLFLTAELVVLRAALPGFPPVLMWSGGAFLALARLAYLLPFDTMSHRQASLLTAVGGLALIGTVLRLLQGLTAREAPRWRWILRRMLWAFAVLLGVAVLANIMGMVGLADLLTRSMIRSTLSGLGVATLAVVLRELVKVGLRTAPIRNLRSVQSHRATISTAAWRFIAWAGFLAWVWATLDAFRLLTPLTNVVGRLLEVRVQLGDASVAPATIVIFGLCVWFAVYVSRVTRFFLDEDVLPRLSLPRGVPGAVSTSVHYVIMALALAFGAAAVGLSLSSLAFVVGALGVGIGFGLQNIVNNFISGLILLFERPIQVGDEVQVSQLMGTMKRIGIRASIVRTYDGSEVIVPNGDLISQQVINYTLSDRYRRMELRVGVAYGTDLDQARAALLRALGSVEAVLEDPASAVLFKGLAIAR